METPEHPKSNPGAGSGGAAPGGINSPQRAPEMVIFSRTFDLLAWLLPHTNHFPRAHRHTVTQRLLDAAMDLREFLEEAQLRRGPARQERLARADEAIAKLRLYLRLATKLGWQTPQQYQHVFQMLMEIGRLLGGWRKASS
ncbi:MAG: diversity-generating retroelement protein Avd [Verrucomicrobiota bacterium]